MRRKQGAASGNSRLRTAVYGAVMVCAIAFVVALPARAITSLAPTVTTSSGQASYSEGGAAPQVDPGLTVGDPDSPEFQGGVVSISANFSSADGDTLNFTNQNGISGLYNSGTGVLTLSGDATLADYQTALRSITFSNTSDNPSSATRTVSFKVQDTDALNSNVATRDVTVTPTNDAPVVTTSAGTPSVAEDALVTIDGAMTVSDADDTNLESAQVRVSVGFQPGDNLDFTDQSGIHGVYNSGTGVLTMTGSATVSDYQAAFRSIQYRHTGDNPSSPKTIEFKANDGTDDSNLATKNITVTGVNDGPTVTTSSGQASYSEGGTAPQVDAGITVSDPDSSQLQGAVVSISANFSSADGDSLNFTNQNGISGVYNSGTGVLTLSGAASIADYETALRSITFSNTSDTPSSAVRTVSFKVTDTSAADSNVASRDVGVTPTNDAPVVTTSVGSTTYSEGDPATTIDGALTVTDADDTNLESAQVRVSSGFQSGDDLVYVDQLGIHGVYNTGTGVLTLTGTASLSDYQTALRSIKFRHTGDNPSSLKTIEFKVNDGDLDSNLATKNVNVTGVNDAPTVTTSSGQASFTENGAPPQVDPGVTVDDPDSAQLQGAVVSISANFSSADGDSLNFTNQNGIGGSYNSGTGVLTLSGASSLANYQTALRSITFSNTSDTPSTATRTVSFKVTDTSSADSNVASRGVTVAQANDAPVVTTSGGSTGYTEGDPATAIDGSLTVADPDSANLASAQVRVSANFQSGDALQFTDQLGITGSYNSGTGVLTLTGSATKSDYQTALRSVRFSTPSDSPSSSKTIQFRANDGSLDSAPASKTLAITGVDDPPTAANDSAQVAEKAPAATIDVLANDGDVDGGPKQVTAVTQPANGTAAIGSGGANVTYQPDASYCNDQPGGTADTFAYTLNGGSHATVSVTVACAPARTITVRKRLVPSSDPGRFNLKINGTTVKATAGNGGAGSAQVDSGSDVTISETSANGHPLTGYAIATDCGPAGSGTGKTVKLTHVTADATCTITNRRRTGQLSISHPVTRVTPTGTLIRLACRGPRGARCAGVLDLEATNFASRLHHARANPPINFDLSAPANPRLRVQVPAQSRAQLANRHRAIARIVVRLAGGETLSRLVTLVGR